MKKTYDPIAFYKGLTIDEKINLKGNFQMANEAYARVSYDAWEDPLMEYESLEELYSSSDFGEYSHAWDHLEVGPMLEYETIMEFI